MYFAVTNFIVLLLTSSVFGTTENYLIPVSINPLIQGCIKLTSLSNMFYSRNQNFYSNVTLSDLSAETETPLKDMVPKAVNVLFLVAVSSEVGESMVIGDLKYTNRSKLSYSVPVVDMLAYAGITEFNDTFALYKIQEYAMKVVERRYNFTVSEVASKRGLERMEFLAPEQNQWIGIVGEITKSFIGMQSEKLNLTPCYLAASVNKTLSEIQAYTLNEVDTNLYDINALKLKVPALLNATLPRFYDAFSVTPTTFPQSSGLKEQIQHYITNILDEFHLQAIDISKKYQKPEEEILVPCEKEWNNTKTIFKEEAFEKDAKNMSITNETLAAVIETPYETVKTLSFEGLKSLISNKIQPVKEQKKMIEETSLSTLRAKHGANFINTNDNVFALIVSLSGLTRHQLSLLYSFTDADYQFAEMFPIADLTATCSSDINSYNLVTLADLSVGKTSQEFSCPSFAALRAIWNNATVDQIETSFSPSNSINDKTLCSVPNASSIALVYRVLSLTEEGKELCSTITLQHLTVVTPRTIAELKSMTFKELVNLIMELKQNGALYPTATTTQPLDSPTLSTTNTAINTEVQTQQASPVLSTINAPINTDVQISQAVLSTISSRTISASDHTSTASRVTNATEAGSTVSNNSSRTNNNSTTSAGIAHTATPGGLSVAGRPLSTKLCLSFLVLVVLFYQSP